MTKTGILAARGAVCREGHADDRPAARHRAGDRAGLSHPDVEELYRRASAIDERISLSTIHRTVSLFEEAGLVTNYDFRDGRRPVRADPTSTTTT